VKIFVLLIASLSLSFDAWADGEREVLACMAGASADIDGSKSYPTNSSSIRFLLTLQKKDQTIITVNLKYTGEMEGYPDYWYNCSVNQAETLYTCANGADVIWYFPARKHGVMASISIMPMMKENRANAAGMYNYSCSEF